MKRGSSKVNRWMGQRIGERRGLNKKFQRTLERRERKKGRKGDGIRIGGGGAGLVEEGQGREVRKTERCSFVGFHG